MSNPELARDILHRLLDRYEQPKRQTVVRVHIRTQSYPDYFSATDATSRRSCNEALQQLENAGVVHLRWKKWEEDNWLDAVDMYPEYADQLYKLLRRIPKTHQQSDLIALLHAQSPHPGWFADFLAWAETQVKQHRSAAPLKLDDPQTNTDLLIALAAIAQLETVISERTLSTQLFANSKRLAELRGAIVQILRRFSPDAIQFDEDDRALLQAHMIERIPQYIPLVGPLVLAYTPVGCEQVLVDMRGVEQGFALPTNMLYAGQVATCQARAVITVENATSFHELLVGRPLDVIIISIGGFASPATLALLHTLRRSQHQLDFYHWGDSDPGGLRILAHLRGSLGTVHPLAMSVATFEQHCQYTQPLTKRDQATLKSLYQHPLLVDCYPLITTLLATKSKLEQEAIAPAYLWEKYTIINEPT